VAVEEEQYGSLDGETYFAVNVVVDDDVDAYEEQYEGEVVVVVVVDYDVV